MPSNQSVERPRQLSSQGLLLKELPIVKARAVRQAESGHKVSAIQRDGLVEQKHALRADLVQRVPMRAALLDQVPKANHVYPQDRTSILSLDQSYLVAVCVQARIAQRFSEDGQISAQIRVGQRRRGVRPKQRGQRFSSLGLSGYGQISQQGKSLATPNLDWLIVQFELGGAEQR
jgi:hypothetical protein